MGHIEEIKDQGAMIYQPTACYDFRDAHHKARTLEVYKHRGDRYGSTKTEA